MSDDGWHALESCTLGVSIGPLFFGLPYEADDIQAYDQISLRWLPWTSLRLGWLKAAEGFHAHGARWPGK